MTGLSVVKSALRKLSSARGGPHNGYFDSGSRITPPLEPETPFAKAFQVVDRRDGYARELARTWRTVSAGLALFSVALGAGWFWEHSRYSTEWLVVPVDRFGEPGEVYRPGVFLPTTSQIAYRAQEVIKCAFGISADQRINEDCRDFLNNNLRGDARTRVIQWIKENDGDRPTERLIRFVTLKPTASPKTLNVIWTEADYRNGKPVYPVRRVNGDITIEYIHEKRADAQKNVLGLYTTAFSFAQEDAK